MDNENTPVADPTAQAPKKVRRSLADRKAEVLEKLRKLEEQEAASGLADAIKNGECHDPETAKKLNAELRYIKTARATFMKYSLCDEDRLNAVVKALQTKMQEAVDGPDA